MRDDYEIIRDDGEEIPEEEIRRPDMEWSKQERRWYALGALKSALMIGVVYLVGLGVLVGLMVWLWK